ncbi:phage antirepressor KilAC domain-containing protein [Gordonibacter urolithinfaciens]|uniref:phage antirepressor KilAC domain-containing protein n=1 Tax=Gordonibacter urolithinfaciens TaxID=1335613 RepID=UPI003A8D3267
MPTGANCTAEVQVFNNDEFGSIQAVEIEGEPWFVAAPVAKALGYADATHMTRRLDDDEKGLHSMETLGGKQSMNVISEPGLYSAILGSKLPSAKAFKRWIVHSVIPSIRRHGIYATPQAAEAMLADPDVMISALQALKAERARVAELSAENAALAPKALFADAVASSDRCILVGDMAKLLKQNGYDTGQRRLFAKLHEDGYLMWSGGKHVPTQRSMDQGLFEIKETTGVRPDGSAWTNFTVKVTGKGQVYFVNRYCGSAA